VREVDSPPSAHLWRRDGVDRGRRQGDMGGGEAAGARRPGRSNGRIRSTRSAPLLDSVSRHQPAFLEAGKLGARAATAGFDWPEPQGLLDKLSEEAEEVSVELRAEPRDQARLEEELGDLFFTAVNLARHLKVEPEFALRRANAKFRARFGLVEMATGGADNLKNATPEEQEALWADAKAAFARTKPTMMEPGF
jgi:uncharacterized protein YabN with tetrapyrrole methylase and pyrophosphatase domain